MKIKLTGKLMLITFISLAVVSLIVVSFIILISQSKKSDLNNQTDEYAQIEKNLDSVNEDINPDSISDSTLGLADKSSDMTDSDLQKVETLINSTDTNISENDLLQLNNY